MYHDNNVFLSSDIPRRTFFLTTLEVPHTYFRVIPLTPSAPIIMSAEMSSSLSIKTLNFPDFFLVIP